MELYFISSVYATGAKTMEKELCKFADKFNGYVVNRTWLEILTNELKKKMEQLRAERPRLQEVRIELSIPKEEYLGVGIRIGMCYISIRRVTGIIYNESDVL